MPRNATRRYPPLANLTAQAVEELHPNYVFGIRVVPSAKPLHGLQLCSRQERKQLSGIQRIGAVIVLWFAGDPAIAAGSCCRLGRKSQAVSAGQCFIIRLSSLFRLCQSTSCPHAATKPCLILKRQIPIRTFADWNDIPPGFFEADLVAHCGDNVEGSFLNTLVLTDVATGWTECLALLRRSEADVTGALEARRHLLPFPLLGLDTDNGGEFINYELLHYCERHRISFTRARAYKKNDQAHVEENNGSVVRRLVGYDRYEGKDAWRSLPALFRVLRLCVNFFQPSMKLASKERDGSKVTKRYDDAQTPY